MLQSALFGPKLAQVLRRTPAVSLALSASVLTAFGFLPAPLHATVAYTPLNFTSIEPAATVDGSAPLVVDGVNVAGSYLSSGATADQGFVYNIATGQFTALTPPGSSSSSCQALSNGEVVGDATDADGGASFGFIYNIGSAGFTSLQPTGSSSCKVTAVSNSTVAGNEQSGSSAGIFLYNIATKIYTPASFPAGFRNVQVAGFLNSYPVGVYTDTSGIAHGFIDSAGFFTTLDPSGSTGTHIAAVDTSLVTGRFTDSQKISHGFLYNSVFGSFVRIDPPGSKNTSCVALNGNTVAGTYTDAGEIQHGFVYNGDTGVYTMLTPPGGVASTCTGISGNYVVGTFTDGTGHTQAFVANLAGTSGGGGSHAAIVTLSGLQLTYNGSPRAVTVTTVPGGLPVTVTYSSATYPASTTPPTTPGTYTVVASVNQPSFVGSATGRLVVARALATIVLSNLTATYNGSGQAVSVTTTPPGLNVTVKYDGGSALPVNAGNHSVQATLNDPDYQGATKGVLTISRSAAVV
ncbi:MAG TPA: MBG domain-containing protein, partial [Candidatus Methylacidiphilales bacterium]|nr:MBG domain-containing protein [Candidatus Methylacidiphilales bacterium]